MKKKMLLSLLFIFLSGSLLFAQDQFTGRWTGKVMDQYEITADYVAKGDSLTGKSIHYDGSSSDITDGKIMGDSISYDISILMAKPSMSRAILKEIRYLRCLTTRATT